MMSGNMAGIQIDNSDLYGNNDNNPPPYGGAPPPYENPANPPSGNYGAPPPKYEGSDNQTSVNFLNNGAQNDSNVEIEIPLIPEPSYKMQSWSNNCPRQSCYFKFSYYGNFVSIGILIGIIMASYIIELPFNEWVVFVVCCLSEFSVNWIVCYVKASSFGRNLIPVDPREKEWLEWFVNNNTWVAKSQIRTCGNNDHNKSVVVFGEDINFANTYFHEYSFQRKRDDQDRIFLSVKSTLDRTLAFYLNPGMVASEGYVHYEVVELDKPNNRMVLYDYKTLKTKLEHNSSEEVA